VSDGYDKGAIIIRESPSNPVTVVAGQGAIYIKNDTPTVPVFVNDNNADSAIFCSGAPIMMSGQVTMSGQACISGYAQVSGCYILSGQAAPLSMSGQCMVSGVNLTSGNIVSIVSGMSIPSGGGNIVSGDVLAGAMSGATVFQTSGVYMTSGTTVSVVSGMSIVGNPLPGNNGSQILRGYTTEEVTIPVGQGAGIKRVLTASEMWPAEVTILYVLARITQAPGGGATTIDVDNILFNAAIGGMPIASVTASNIDNPGAMATPWHQPASEHMYVETNANVTVSDMKVRLTVFWEQVTNLTG